MMQFLQRRPGLYRMPPNPEKMRQRQRRDILFPIATGAPLLRDRESRHSSR
jgi:hypothetical protein